MGIVSINPDKKAAIDRATALANLDFWFANVIADGFVTPAGWKLGMQESDVALLTGQFVLAREAAAAEMPLPPVVDAAGVPHQIETIEELSQIMLLYGQARAALSSEYASRKAAILSDQGA